MKNKGQWFLLSAVIASAVFLSLSILYQGYFSVDDSGIIRTGEDFLFLDIVTELNRTLSYPGSATEVESNVNEFIYFAEKEALEYGYFLEIDNTSAISSSGTNFTVSVSTFRMNVTKRMTLP